ncbi:MAG: hypothetical protein U5L96_10845 [Owenweeksia sp.]|nr:hypothetical protein [Owenweeksia sp.]
MQGSQGIDSANRLVVTNFLGQVESQNGIDLQNPNFVRLTGKYDETFGYGHRYYRGSEKNGSTVSFGFSHGTYGLYVNNQWQNENTGTGVLVSTNNTGVEIDHIEVANGFSTGILLGWKDNHSIAEYNHIHHNFIHEIGGTGLKMGFGGSFPQQVFPDARIENNAFLRCGNEGVQVSWLMGGSLVRNNFIHAAYDWKSPIARWQDNVLQVEVLGGPVRIDNNILMGGGGGMANFRTQSDNIPINYGTDTLHVKNNLFYGARGDQAIYGHSESDGKTHVAFDGNFFAKIGYDYDEVYLNTDTTKTLGFNINFNGTDKYVRNNAYDGSIENLTTGSANIFASNNLAGQVQPLH